MLVAFIILFILWTIFGSFSSVLIERWHAHKSGIMTGRSECPSCHHTLTARELIPLISYLIQWGKCHNCHKRIPYFYPLVEVFFGILFVLLWYVSISLGYAIISWNTLLLLVLGFITWVYMVYDIRYMEIPDQIMVPWILWLIILLWIIFFDHDIGGYTHDYSTYVDASSYVADHLFGALIVYTFFYLQILLPGGMYYLKKKQYKNFIELCLSYVFFPFMLIIDSVMTKQKKNDEEEEIPTWVGGGDLRIALFIGLSLGTLHSISTLFFAYIVWSIIWIILISTGRSSNSQVPFWPFLWLGWILSLVFYNDIISLIEKYNMI